MMNITTCERTLMVCFPANKTTTTSPTHAIRTLIVSGEHEPQLCTPGSVHQPETGKEGSKQIWY